MGRNKKHSHKKAHNAHKNISKGKSDHMKGETPVNTNSNMGRPSTSNKNSLLETNSKCKSGVQNDETTKGKRPLINAHDSDSESDTLKHCSK